VSAVETIASIVTENLDIWTNAIERKSSAGRGRVQKLSLYGIEKLRALILELAVRGKLVPQDANDGSATELLKHIKAERKRLVATGEIREAREFKNQSSVNPYRIPENWLWVQVSEVGHDWGQTTPSSNFTYIDVGSIDQRLGRVHDPAVLDSSSAPSRARKRVREGTVIYSTIRPYLLNVAIISQSFDPEPIASTAFAIVHPFDGVASAYVYHYLRSPPFVAYVEGCQTGIAYPAINDKQFFSAPFPLPPEGEQRRIVAKLDELMALCDALELETYEAIEAHELLVENLLATLTSSQDAQELAENWTRLETHFDTLFSTEVSIDQLKQTILQLAVMGKLVPQGPNDEPALELLKEIEIRRKRLYAEKQIPKPKAIPSIEEIALPFSVPKSWSWSTLGELCYQVSDGPHFSPHYVEPDQGVPFLSTRNVRVGAFDLSTIKYVSRSDHEEFCKRIRPEKDDILYTKGGTTGIAKVNDLDFEFSVWVHLAVLRIEKERLFPS
jgi:type I restriction enzyme S subunit